MKQTAHRHGVIQIPEKERAGESLPELRNADLLVPGAVFMQSWVGANAASCPAGLQLGCLE